jgi:hypothetical protein
MPPDRPQRVTLPTLQILAAVADLAVLDLGEGALGYVDRVSGGSGSNGRKTTDIDEDVTRAALLGLRTGTRRPPVGTGRLHLPGVDRVRTVEPRRDVGRV